MEKRSVEMVPGFPGGALSTRVVLTHPVAGFPASVLSWTVALFILLYI